MSNSITQYIGLQVLLTSLNQLSPNMHKTPDKLDHTELKS